MDVLASYLDLNQDQQTRVKTFKLALEKLSEAGVMPHELTNLKLSNTQIERIARGDKVDAVLTKAQQELRRNEGPPESGS